MSKSILSKAFISLIAVLALALAPNPAFAQRGGGHGGGGGSHGGGGGGFHGGGGGAFHGGGGAVRGGGGFGGGYRGRQLRGRAILWWRRLQRRLVHGRQELCISRTRRDSDAVSMPQDVDTQAATDTVLEMRSLTATGILLAPREAPRMQEVQRDFAHYRNWLGWGWHSFGGSSAGVARGFNGGGGFRSFGPGVGSRGFGNRGFGGRGFWRIRRSRFWVVAGGCGWGWGLGFGWGGFGWGWPYWGFGWDAGWGWPGYWGPGSYDPWWGPADYGYPPDGYLYGPPYAPPADDSEYGDYYSYGPPYAAPDLKFE